MVAKGMLCLFISVYMIVKIVCYSAETCSLINFNLLYENCDRRHSPYLRVFVYLYHNGMSQLKTTETIQEENTTSCFVRLRNFVSNCKV